MFGKIKGFFAEVVSELKKVSWTTRRDLIDTTWVVIGSSALLGVCIAVFDVFLSQFVKFFIR